MDVEHEKALAASQALKLVESGMVVGLGSGSTSAIMIRKLGQEIVNGLSIIGVPSSEKVAKLAHTAGIPLTTLNKVRKLDINIDGADEFNDKLHLIKGGGGALLREKILAYNSKYNVIIADSSKQVRKLGKFRLPLETIPFATKSIIADLTDMGLKPLLRQRNGIVFRTDENNFIVDIDILGFGKVRRLNNLLLNIPGIVESGLFLGTTDLIIMGKNDLTIVLKKNGKSKISRNDSN